MAGAGMSLAHKALYTVPVCFAIGICVKDYVTSASDEDAIVEKRVQQRLGIWKPPVLSPAQVAALMKERAALVTQIDQLEAHMAERKRKEQARQELHR